MQELYHWHPVLQSTALSRTPISVTLCGQDIVLFRSANGVLGALKDVCPHRRMRLSAGWVEDDRLVCPYHGWSYASNGTGHSPGTPKLRPWVQCFEVVERYGWVWLTAAGSTASFPAFERPGYHLACTLEHRFDAPLELVIDNFAEIEHAPTIHTFFGYALAQSAAAQAQVDYSAEDCIHLLSSAPQRPLPWMLEQLFGVRRGDRFENRLEMRFSPVYNTYDISWIDQTTAAPRPERLLSVFFFNPITAERTQCVSFHYVAAPRWGRAVFHLLQKHLLKWTLDHEVKRDKWVLERLATQQTDVAGMCLGRFDKLLVEHRRRIQRLYRGLPQPRNLPGARASGALPQPARPLHSQEEVSALLA